VSACLGSTECFGGGQRSVLEEARKLPDLSRSMEFATADDFVQIVAAVGRRSVAGASVGGVGGEQEEAPAWAVMAFLGGLGGAMGKVVSL
jgi:hypothetical protein